MSTDEIQVSQYNGQVTFHFQVPLMGDADAVKAQEQQRDALLSTLKGANIPFESGQGENRTNTFFSVSIPEEQAKAAANAIEQNSFHNSTILVADGKIIAAGKNAAEDPEVQARMRKEAQPVEAPKVETPQISQTEQAILDAAGKDKILTEAELKRMAATISVSEPGGFVPPIPDNPAPMLPRSFDTVQVRNQPGTADDKVIFKDGIIGMGVDLTKIGIKLDTSFKEGTTDIPTGGRVQIESSQKGR